MNKKMLSSIFLAASLMFFVSCQQQDGKKDNQKKTSYQRNSRKGTYQRGKKDDSNQSYQKNGKKNTRATMPKGKCPKDEPCSSESKKTCPSGCKKKCCVNEAGEKAISEREEALLQEKQEIISLQDLTNKGLPLEELKAAIENDSLNIE